MKTNIIILLTVFLGFTVKAQDANKILSKVDNTILAVKDKTADIEMEMTNTNTGKGSLKKAVLMQKGADKKIFRYTFPKSDKGIATLTLPGQVYLYLPMFKKPKKITNMAQSNAFNKSDFSLADSGLLPYAKHFNAKIQGENQTSYVLDLTPKKEIEQYSHLVMTVNKKYYYPEKIEYFDKSGKKQKAADYKYKKIGKYWVADVVTMKDFQRQHKTTIKMTNIKINQGLKDSDFTVEKLIPSKKK